MLPTVAPAFVPPIVTLSPDAAPVTTVLLVSLTVMTIGVALPATPPGTEAVELAALRAPVTVTETVPVVVVVPDAVAVA